MPNPRLASRYAQSLLDLAIEQNNVAPVLEDMKTIESVFSGSEEMSSLLQSPFIKSDKKLAVINAVFEGKLNNLTLSFLTLLVKKGREGDLQEMAAMFQTQYEALNNIQTVQITSATPLDADTLEILSKRISGQLNNNKLIFETTVDPSIIGGFKLQVGDKYFDASISRDLNDIKHQFTKNVYEPEIAIDRYKVKQ